MERLEKLGRLARPGKTERHEKPGKTEKPGKPEKHEKTEKPGKTEGQQHPTIGRRAAADGPRACGLGLEACSFAHNSK